MRRNGDPTGDSREIHGRFTGETGSRGMRVCARAPAQFADGSAVIASATARLQHGCSTVSDIQCAVSRGGGEGGKSPAAEPRSGALQQS